MIHGLVVIVARQVDGEQLRPLMMMSGLPMDVLGSIWSMADEEQQGRVCGWVWLGVVGCGWMLWIGVVWCGRVWLACIFLVNMQKETVVD